jgi:hypothetical protein
MSEARNNFIAIGVVGNLYGMLAGSELLNDNQRYIPCNQRLFSAEQFITSPRAFESLNTSLYYKMSFSRSKVLSQMNHALIFPLCPYRW